MKLFAKGIDSCCGHKEGSIVEEWRRAQNVSTSAQDESKLMPTSSTSIKPQKKVVFSEFSSRPFYRTDPSYEASKCSTSAERKRSRKEAINEGMRIQHLVSLCPLPTGRAVQELLKTGVVTCEELLGIEHLCSPKLSEQALHGRVSHTHLVLRAQDELSEKHGQVDAEKLGAVILSKSLGSRNIEKARQRAMLAVEQNK
jgi:hypothetical protein